MRRIVARLQELLGKSPRRASRPLARLELQPLEDRWLPSTLTGLVYVDANGNGVHDRQEVELPGVQVKLSGTSAANQRSVSTGTNAAGSFAFQNVPAASYDLNVAARGFQGGRNVTITSINSDQRRNLAVRGLAPDFVSLRQFLTTTTTAEFPLLPAGRGEAEANHAPVVRSRFQDIVLASGNRVLDLISHFDDADYSRLRLETSVGPVNIELFDGQAPLTVANFFRYAESNRLDNTIFHRLVPNFVLQGGGFKVRTNAAGQTSLPAVVTDPPVQNEFFASNLTGTLAMAKVGNDPNSATSQFFFNLADNSINLDSQNSGFTVFARVADEASQDLVTFMAATPVQHRGGVFDDIPLDEYRGTRFPTDAVRDNFVVLNDVVTLQHNAESLTFTASSDSSAVTAAITGGKLTLTRVSAGTAVITVRATDQFGLLVETTFRVT